MAQIIVEVLTEMMVTVAVTMVVGIFSKAIMVITKGKNECAAAACVAEKAQRNGREKAVANGRAFNTIFFTLIDRASKMTSASQGGDMCRLELLEAFLPDRLGHAVRRVHTCHSERPHVAAIPGLVVEEKLMKTGGAKALNTKARHESLSRDDERTYL